VPPALFKDAESALSEIPRREMLSLAPRDYLGLVIHLAVSAARKDEGYELEEALADEGGGAAEAEVAARVAALALEGMARKTGAEYGPADLRSTYRYLMGAKPERPGAAYLGEIDLAALAELKEFIAACGELYGRPFSDDAALRDGLAAHWGPALYRLRNRLPIRNPLLAQIRSEYGELFASIRAAADRVLPELRLPDDEIGYLAMHFGSSLERRAKAGGRFRALVVCSAGIGSAQMLASRLKAELPEIDIVASLSWFDIQALDRDACDILVSTIPLPIPAEEYILVNPLLPPEGIAALKGFMARRRDRISASPPPLEREREEARFDDMKAMNERLAASISILERLRVFGAEGGGRRSAGLDWKAFLGELVDRCASEGLLEDPALVLRDLELRSADRGILLPDSSLLFLHARSSGLRRPSLSLHVLGDAPAAPEARWERRPTRLILMLAPPGLGQATQEVLNEISSSFLEQSAVEALEAGDESLLRKYYTRLLDRFARS
jgi:mannitol operon transcriptional antiterminator